MRRLLAAAGIAGLILATMLIVAGPAGAADAKGCSGSGVSVDGDITLDRASAPGKGGTKNDPFDVTTDGEIRYQYRVSRGALSGGRWTAEIDTGIIPISFSGAIEQGSSQEGDGVEPLKKHLQVGGLSVLTGLLKIDIKARAGGIRCTVSGYLKIHASVFTTPAFYLAIILLVLALLLFYFGMGAAV